MKASESGNEPPDDFMVLRVTAFVGLFSSGRVKECGMKHMTKQSLTPSRRRLLTLMQGINFGRIEGLRVADGDPVFEPMPRVVRQVKFCAEHQPRPEKEIDDFRLKNQVVEMFDVLTRLSRELTPEDVESFKALGVEVHVKSKPGEFSLVPEYTDKAGNSRTEISAEDLRKLSMIMHAFPGSEITYVGPQQEPWGYAPVASALAPKPSTPPSPKPQPTEHKPTQPPEQARLF